jgi:methylene-fatty-acyl-phospholipid synthase
MDAYLLCAILSFPHAFYFVLWKWPKLWMRAVKKLLRTSDPCDVMATCAHGLKILQAVAIVYWLSTHCVDDCSVHAVLLQPGWRLLCGVFLIAVGQTLNVSVYMAIGKHGVYYGHKFGKRIPWCTKFPYNFRLSHPQYVGGVLTFWGCAALLWLPSLVDAGLGVVCLVWTAYYVATACVEDFVE